MYTWLVALDKDRLVGSLFMIFLIKTFDMVDHGILMKKLKH